jgi:hypothetical protein
VTGQVPALEFLAQFFISITELGGNPLDVAPPSIAEMDRRLAGARCGCGRDHSCRLAESVAV